MSDTSKLPWTVELEPYHRARRLITVVSPRGVVARCGDTTMPGATEDAALIVRAVNAHADLVYACTEALAYLDQYHRGDDLRVATILQNVLRQAKAGQL